jgi:CRP/FNR family transcriptional regulator, anaerobic regulatory protein
MEFDIQQSRARLLKAFPYLSAVSDAEWLAAQPFAVSFPAKARLFNKDDASRYGMFLLSGTARITLIEENGNESVLNLLNSGEVCSLLVLSGLSDREYPGSLIAETDVEAIFLSKSSFLRWIQQYESIRNAIFGGLLDGTLRMSELLRGRQTMPLEARLAKAILRASSEEEPRLAVTHKELAAESGSVREVVSRTLLRFQRKGWIVTGRGWVEVTRRSDLEALLGD